MPDPRFFGAKEPVTLAEATAAAGADAARGSAVIRRAASLAEDDLGDAVVYCADERALARLERRAVGLCLTTRELAETAKIAGAILGVESPKRAFALIAARLHFSLEEVEPAAAGDVHIHADADIHPSATIGAGAEIGRGARVGPNCRIGRGVAVGEGARIEAGATVTHAVIGGNVRLLAGVRIGQPGFGFVESETGPLRMPQLGRVVIGDDVEIGANSTVDRGTLDDTVVGEGTKIDNLVQIGHNVRIGRYCVLAAQSGVAGSCRIGDRVMIGGQVGVADHVTVGDGAQIAGQSGVSRDVPPGARWGGCPARPAKEWLRETATLAKLARKRDG